MVGSIPDFIGIGAQRCGTSWMAMCFWEHPEIFMPGKELHFFDRQKNTDVSEYFAKFIQTDKTQGEFTPDYLSDREAIDLIAENCPSTKLIVVLRDPAERTMSSFKLYKERGKLEDHITCLDDVYKKGHPTFKKSLYGKQIEYLFSKVDPDNVLVVYYDDIRDKPQDLLKRVYEFIGVNRDFVPSSLRQNFNSSSLIVENAKINSVLTSVQNYLYKRRWGLKLLQLKKTDAFIAFKAKLIAKKKTNADETNKYKQFFEDDLDLLESLLKTRVPDSWRQLN